MVQIAPLLSVIATVAQVSSAARDIPSDALAARQDTSDLPSQCQSSCEVINTMTNCGGSISCICVSSVGTELQSCMSCLTQAEPSVESEAQSSLSSWNEACGGSLSLSGGSTGTSANTGTSTKTSTTSTTTSSGGSLVPTTSSSSSSSNPLAGGKTGDAVGIKAATGAFGLAVAIACGVLIL